MKRQATKSVESEVENRRRHLVPKEQNLDSTLDESRLRQAASRKRDRERKTSIHELERVCHQQRVTPEHDWAGASGTFTV